MYLDYKIKLQNIKDMISVFVDIDGTLIGNIIPFIIIWELIQIYCPKNLSKLRSMIIYHLRQGILRRGFADFAYALRQRFPDVYFFIFTASETKWASFLVPCIEEAMNFKFERPIFSRQHCPTMIKSINKIMPNVIRSIKKRNPDVIKKDHFSILIDNSNVIHKCEKDKWIEMKTYDYCYYPDILSFLDEHIIVNHYNDILEILKKYNFMNNVMYINNYTSFRIQYYLSLSTNIRMHSNYIQDDEWFKLEQVMTKVTYDDQYVKNINRKLKKRHEENSNDRRRD